MSILNLFNNQRFAANERRDKELIVRTLTKNPKAVEKELDRAVSLYLGAMVEFGDSGHKMMPHGGWYDVINRGKDVLDLFGINPTEGAASFSNGWNPTNSDILQFMDDSIGDWVEYENDLDTSNHLDDSNPMRSPAIMGLATEKYADRMWNRLVRDKTANNYSQQILLWWSRGSTAENLFEDLPAVVDSIKLFEKHKNSLTKNNISQYKRWDQLNEALEPVRVAEAAENRDLRLESGETVDEIAELTEEQKEFADPKQMRFPGIDPPQDAGNMTVKQISSFEEAKVLGEGTTWCFTNSPNYYSQYSGRGPIYVVLDNGDPKVGIGIDGDWDIEIRNSNNGSLNEEEQELYGPIIERIKNLDEMVEALENAEDENAERVIYECEYCEAEVYGYGNDDDEWHSVGDHQTCSSCENAYSCIAGGYEHGWKNPDGSYDDARDEEIGDRISSCWDCAENDEIVSQCINCEGIIFKEIPYWKREANDPYFTIEEGDLCQYCGEECSICGEAFIDTDEGEDFVCNNCKQMKFPEVEQEPVYEQTGLLPEWDGGWPGFFPQGE